MCVDKHCWCGVQTSNLLESHSSMVRFHLLHVNFEIFYTKNKNIAVSIGREFMEQPKLQALLPAAQIVLGADSRYLCSSPRKHQEAILSQAQ